MARIGGRAPRAAAKSPVKMPRPPVPAATHKAKVTSGIDGFRESHQGGPDAGLGIWITAMLGPATSTAIMMPTEMTIRIAAIQAATRRSQSRGRLVTAAARPGWPAGRRGTLFACCGAPTWLAADHNCWGEAGSDRRLDKPNERGRCLVPNCSPCLPAESQSPATAFRARLRHGQVLPRASPACPTARVLTKVTGCGRTDDGPAGKGRRNCRRGGSSLRDPRAAADRLPSVTLRIQNEVGCGSCQAERIMFRGRSGPGGVPVQQRPADPVVADELREQILAGRYAPGERLPTMQELRRAYGVSEIVIRHAVSVLRLEGLVETRRGGGTVVRVRPQVSRAMERYSADARQAAQQYPAAGQATDPRTSFTEDHGIEWQEIPSHGPLLRDPGGRGARGAVRRRTGNGPAAQALRVLRPRET